jgi:hypothetical protein
MHVHCNGAGEAGCAQPPLAYHVSSRRVNVTDLFRDNPILLCQNPCNCF